MSEFVRIVEVGPRDGLQNESKMLTVAQRVELIKRLADCGHKTIEAGAFVSPKWVPQMADTADVLAALPKLPGVNLPVLVPNARGMEDAIAAGAKEVAIFTAASDEFNIKNTNVTIAESYKRFAEVFDLANQHGIKVRGYISTVVGCPYSGDVEAAKVAEVTAKLLQIGCYEISLGDTIGVGTPKSTKKMLKAVLEEVPAGKLALHCHDTYGQAIANIYAGLEMGIRVFDASTAGLGGCPYAKGASGNVATEDVVYMLNCEGFETGLAMSKLIETAHYAASLLGKSPQGKVAHALKV